MSFQIKMKVDLKTDLGQNRGTLFEATDSTGQVIAGAGYQAVYNTESRSDQRTLQFFIKPKDRTHTITALPRVNDDAGVYLYSFNNQVYAHSRSNGQNPNQYVWQDNTWTLDDAITPFSQYVDNRVLEVTRDHVRYDGETILKIDRGNIGAHYYANGTFVFRHHHAESDPPLNQIVACPWQSGKTMSRDQGVAIDMKTDYEFVYAYGHLGENILAITNIGGIYRFNGQSWATLREPVLGVSFQVYSILTYYDKLLLGHYPTGELYEYKDDQINLLTGWPPVMPGVSDRAREAQTMAIFGGELYVGVWPWAELWRYDGSNWQFVQRLFPHPEPTDATTHPYENETKALDEVINRWGQRITSLVLHESGLFLSTSSKGSTPYEEKFTFLANDKWKDYGTVYQIQIPGQLSAHTNWVDGPTTFEFVITDKEMQILQDDQIIGRVSINSAPEINPENITYGYGIFGSFSGDILEHTTK